MEFDSLLKEFSPLSSPNIRNQVNNFKLSSAIKGSIDQILDLKRRCLYDYIQNIVFLGQGSPENFLNSRCLLMVLLVSLILWGTCNQKEIWKEHGWCLTTTNMCNSGQPSLSCLWSFLSSCSSHCNLWHAIWGCGFYSKYFSCSEDIFGGGDLKIPMENW